MKKFYLFQLILLISYCHLNAQSPGVRWSRQVYGGNFGPTATAIYDIQPGRGGGTIIVGTDSLSNYNGDSAFFNKTFSDRIWVSKLDDEGDKVWSYINYRPQSALTAVTGINYGYASTGYTNVYGTDKVQLYLLRMNSDGGLIDEQLFGGSGEERAYGIYWSLAEDVLMAGFTNSHDSYVYDNHSTDGKADAWIVRIDSMEQLVLRRCYGGSGDDTAFAVTSGFYGYTLVGTSNSSDGDVPGNNGGFDGWILGFDFIGQVRYSKNIGGSGDDQFYKVIRNADGTALLVGNTTSADAAPNGNKGKSDVWVVKINAAGDVIWSKTFGGSGMDKAYSVTATQDGGYLIGATTNSTDGDVTGAIGNYDGWLLKISADGNLEWQKIVGTADNDLLFGAVYNQEHDFTVAGLKRAVYPGPQAVGFVANLGNTSHLKGTLSAPAGFTGALVTAAKTGYSRSSAPVNNKYAMDIEPGTYTVSIDLQNPYYTVTPASAMITSGTFFDTATADFVIQPIAGRQDLSINVVPLTIPRPGFEQQYKIIYRNSGTTTVPSGSASFVADDRFDFISAEPVPVSQTGNTFTWNYTNLAPFDSASILVKLKIKAPPVVNNGDTLTSYALIDPVAGDLTPADDTANLRQIVSGSFDPNDKLSGWGGFMPISKVASSPYIDYVIRFQNTGTDTAFNIHVRDTLDQRLDWSSFQMISASHPYQLSVGGGNRLDWEFASINLVDSNRNEPASHGYIAYRVRTKNNIPVGDTIHNLASIYFDYNLPVSTNNAFTRIVNASVALPLSLLDFNAGYQDPNAVLFWQTAEEYNFDRFEIERSADAIHFEKIGEVPSGGTSGGFYQFKEDLSARAGSYFYYRLKMVDQGGPFTYSRTQLVRKGSGTNTELTISPNPVYYGAARVYVNLHAATDVQLSIIDLQGRVLHQQSRKLATGFNSLLYDMSLFPAGSYIFKMKAGSEIKTSRFLLIR